MVRENRISVAVYTSTLRVSPISEVELLQSVIRRDVGVETSVRQQRDGLQIYVPLSFVTDMTAYIYDEVLSSMRYKLPG
jgi:hypothetical protein